MLVQSSIPAAALQPPQQSSNQETKFSAHAPLQRVTRSSGVEPVGPLPDRQRRRVPGTALRQGICLALPEKQQQGLSVTLQQPNHHVLGLQHVRNASPPLQLQAAASCVGSGCQRTTSADTGASHPPESIPTSIVRATKQLEHASAITPDQPDQPVAAQHERRKVRFSLGSLPTLDGHPDHEGVLAQRVRIDMDPLCGVLHKREVVQLEELLGEEYIPSILKLKRRVGLLPPQPIVRPFVTSNTLCNDGRAEVGSPEKRARTVAPKR